MMIIQDEEIFKAESTMIAEPNSIIKDDEINDLSVVNLKRPSTDDPLNKPNEDFYKSPNKRKQIKPNRLTNDNEPISNGQTSAESPSNTEQASPLKQQEAYCHLCERSFCNKYFLKTHFAKKHGVLNIASPSLSPPSPSPPPPTLPPAPIVPPEQPSPLIVNQKISEDYCEICQKRFCNKYYLRKHKGECHGIYTDYIKSLQKSTNESPAKSQPTRPSQGSTINTHSLLNNPFYLPTTTTNAVSPSPQRTLRRCHLCQQEFRNRALLRIHINTFHPNESAKKMLATKNTPMPPFLLSPTANLGFLQPYVDTTSQLAHKLVAGQAPPTSYGILHDSYFCAKMADRVVCEICNKQVCNKYFLKTHKAKVHGISNGSSSNGGHDSKYDHLPPTMVPQQFPASEMIKSPSADNLNEDQTEQDNDNSSPEPLAPTDENTASYCSLCKKDFPSKYLYLFHMQTMHSETSDPTYQTLLQLMKAATAMNENGGGNPFLALAASLNDEQQGQSVEQESDDESDGTIERLKRKRSSSQTSNDPAKRLHALSENNGGLQPFLIESEDPKFAHTFVPCMVYLPVIRRVTKQVKISLRLKPVLADTTS